MLFKTREKQSSARLIYCFLILLLLIISLNSFLASVSRGEDKVLTGTCEVNATILVFNRRGGGKIDFFLSGEIASELRKYIDRNGDGIISGDHSIPGEGGDFVEHIENKVLDNNGIGTLYRGVWTYDKSNTTSSTGLNGVNTSSKEPLTLHIEFKADVKENCQLSNLSVDPIFNEIVKFALEAPNSSYNNSSIALDYSIKLKVLWTPLGSLKVSEESSSATIKRFRIFAGEWLYYSNEFTYTGPDSYPLDIVEFWYWKWNESALELGIFTILSAFLTGTSASRYFYKQKMEKIGWLHRTAVGISAGLFILYILALLWLLQIILNIACIILANLLCWGIYQRQWFGLSKKPVETGKWKAIRNKRKENS